jgi:hypothetical protein
MNLPLRPFSAFRCPWVAPFHGILSTGVGSFSHGTIQLSHTYSPLPGTFHSQQSTGPSPSAVPFEHLSAAAPGNDPSPFALSSFMSTIPRSESWHRIGQNFAFRLYPHLPHGSSRSMFVFPVSRPFVCGCHNISTILSLRTIPGLPGSHTPLPHRVARKHLGTMRWNPNAFASIVQAQPFPIFGRPVHLRDESHRLQPGGSPQTLQTPPRGGRPVLRSCLQLQPVRHYPHLWISTRGLGPSGTLTHLRRVLPGTHYAFC